jgi:GH15 family glucan-1,4-alpha-glucosidase
MALPIEDYAAVGDGHSMALVGRDGSIDWLCLPRFDSDACFAALVGHERNGRWLIGPVGPAQQTRRRYRGDTMVLETEFETADGVVRLVDFMPTGHELPSVARIVEGVRGRVPMRMELTVRFDYGQAVPWARLREREVTYVAGPDALVLRAPIETSEDERGTVAEFTVGPRDRIPFVLSWYPSWQPTPAPFDPLLAILDTATYWTEWVARCTYQGDWPGAVTRSLLVLKALTHAPTGGIVAAATTSLPEQLGGTRNWDYRFCWLRDAILTVNALNGCGYDVEALAYRDWLLRAVAGDPGQIQTMYGLAGERRLQEETLDWLPGYEGAAPVRIGNAAARQFQLDVFGEVLGVAYLAHSRARARGWRRDPPSGWKLELALLDHLASVWEQPDEGIWEVRGPRRHFTHSKVMAWFAFICAARQAELLDLPGPVAEWRAIADRIHRQVCSQGYDPVRNTFTQSYGSRALDASLLTLPILGFLPPDDPRIAGTIAAVERELMVDGLLVRYSTEEAESPDGLPPGEGAFLACSFWLVGAYALANRSADARALFERLLALRNDVGLLSEEYDPRAGRMVGNFPQGFSHLAMINAALLVAKAEQASARPGPELVACGDGREGPTGAD